MIAFTRFRVPAADEASFGELARAAVEFYRTRSGCQDARLVRNLDDPSLWALVSEWDGAGSYRRAYNGFDAKMILTPLLLLAVDEPGAFDDPETVGVNEPRMAP